MSELNLKQLVDILSQIDESKINGSTIELSINNSTQEELEEIQTIIKQCQKHQSIDYSKYFTEIESSAFYKPGNPKLAITGVAKKHKLDAQKLKSAFKNKA